MPRVRKLVECVGAALCEYATAALARLVPFETALLEVARSVHRRVAASMTASGLRSALRELVSSSPETIELGLHDGVADIRPAVSEEFRETLVAYLELLPEVARQALRRPGDPDGTSVPEGFEIRRAEDWLLFLPDRLPLFRTGDLPPGLDNWRVESLRGLGPYAEVWDGYDDDQPDLSPACLKFITEPKAREALERRVDHVKQVLELEPAVGLIMLRSAYFGSDPPCLEYVHLPGYDLANVMHNARWKGDRPRPEQAALIVRRVARIVGKLHRLDPPVVHRGLKPSNILLSTTDTGGVSAWVSDVGWGQITSSLPMTGLDVSQAIRRSLRGSYAPMYASRQQRGGAEADPRDDVYAIGVLWYQLLMRDPTSKPPGGVAWAADLRRYGLTDGQATVLANCVSKNAADRPADGIELADLIAANSGPTRNGDSGAIRLRGTSHETPKLRPRDGADVRLKVKVDDDEDDDE
jgi:hypothetical protein